MDRLVLLLTLAAALGSGLIAGTFFGFSSFVMRALERLPAAQGLAAMQSINVVVINPVFLGVFLGTAALCLGLGGVAVWQWSARPGAGWLLAGALLYLIGTLGVTMVCNVPRNDDLAPLAASEPASAAAWASYLIEWTRWNTVRTVAALAALGCFGWALRGQ